MNHKRSTASSPFKIRIVHLVYSFDTGGMEKGICTTINHRSNDFEHIIVCLTSSGEMVRHLPEGTPVIAMGKKPGNSLRFLVELSRLLKRLQPAVVHTRNWSGIDGIFAARLAGIRTIVHGEHGWGMDDPYGKNPKRRWIRRIADLGVCEYTCVSKQMKDWLENDIKVRSPVTQIYNGIDTNKFRPAEKGEKGSLRRKLNLPEDTPIIGVVARLDPIKNHRSLFRAFETVRTVLPEACLLVVGDGPERKSLESQAGDGVIFLGNRSDVPEILRALDLFVLPSLNEGISNTILEAMATGTPVVATRVGGNPELVEDECTGILVKPGDFQSMASAILRYLEHADLRARHSEAGRQSVLKRFSIEAMVRSYEAIYRRLDRRH
jgi:sugar transferase (PEP-CTERM/EpsH1 system associated)